MKVLILLYSFIFIACALELNVDPSTCRNFFNKWKRFHNKEYNDLLDEKQHFATWISNWKKVLEHNLKYDINETSYRLEINSFSQLNSNEFSRMMYGYRNDNLLHRKSSYNYLQLLQNINNISLAKSVDWRKSGYVTEVKDQDNCGSCWAFSATGSLEGQNKKKTGKLVSLSEQNLVDCSKSEGNNGCQGGLMNNAFKYKEADRGAECKDYVDLPEGDEEALKQAVATVGPISVAIYTKDSTFMHYSSNIYDEPDCSNTTLIHAVLVVGYGTEDGRDYWLVKNSWGKHWGDNGYIKMSRNKNNQCGIANHASYPLV